VTFAGDASQVHTETAPHVMAALRNLAIGALRRTEPVSLAAALIGATTAATPTDRWPPGHQPRTNRTSRKNAGALPGRLTHPAAGVFPCSQIRRPCRWHSLTSMVGRPPHREATGLAVGSPGPGWAVGQAQGRALRLLVHAPPKLPIVLLQLAEGQHPTTSR
jgi:hypothetical protein